MGDLDDKLVPDHEPNVSYFRYVGDTAGNTPLLGDVWPDSIHQVTDSETAAVLKDHDDYRVASKQDWEAQEAANDNNQDEE